MVTIRSVNEIILSLIDFFKLAQPDLDTKPGTVGRDLFIDGPSSQLALLYDQLSNVSQQQSLRLVVGTDLDNLSKNFGIIRKKATPSSGSALLTFATLNATININSGSVIIANNGFAFSVSNGVSVVPSSANFYRSVASKFSAQLALAGITDQYAVPVTLVATTAGTAGNIGSYSLSRTTIPGVSNVTNVSPFSGGTDQENDAAFRNRVLSSFTGSSVGTTLGYLNTALSTTGVSDAYVAGPGNPLMTRDGTVSKIINGHLTVVSEGSGGDVDVFILGSQLVQNTDTFIYQDKSNNNDPANVKNNFVLGQIAADAGKTVSQKRVSDIAAGTLPAQPVENIVQVTGSLSGGNFAPRTVDQFGRVSGNYQLIKDTGVYAGSPWGFDTFHWVSNQITGFTEALIKGQYNGQDALTFSGVQLVPRAQQSIGITNENSTVTFNRSIIQLLHTPATNVTRVFNVTTGERYVITNQNFDNTGTFNTSGRIQISGNTLPSPSDGLQVDYSWIVSYDPYSDYDGFFDVQNPRPVNDSLDWGLGNSIKNERVLFNRITGNNFFQGNASHPVDTVITAKTFLEVDGYVQIVTSGTFINRLSVVVRNLANPTTSVDSIVLKNTNQEIFNTAQANSNVTNSTAVVGIHILNVTTIILPTDAMVQLGQHVSVILNSTDVFLAGSGQGSSSGSQITIPSAQLVTLANSLVLRVTYLASVSGLFSSSITSMPASRAGNGYLLSDNNGFTNFSVVDMARRENQIIQLNLSNQFFVELNLPSSDYNLIASQIISVIRLSDGKELWTSSNPGTVTVGGDGNFQLIFSGFNTPLAADRVLVIYYATDLRRFQPFSYSNIPIKTRTDILTVDPLSGKFTVALNKFISQNSGVVFSIIEPNTDIVLFSVTDGYVVSQGATAAISSPTVSFASIPGLANKKLKITGSTLLGSSNTNNNGLYDIVSFNPLNNVLVITEILDNITADHISIIRVVDGQEVWNYSGTIDIPNNRVLFPITPPVVPNDKIFVMFFNFKVLRKGPTRLISTIADQVTNTGVVTVTGTTLALAQDVVFTATSTGLKLNLAAAMRTALNLPSTASVPTNMYIAKIVKVEKVTTVSLTNPIVLQTLATYDTINTELSNNLLYPDIMLQNTSLSSLDFVLPSTTNNTSTVNGLNNLPTLGDQIRITFYYATTNDQENLGYTRIGTLYTNKKFAFMNRIFVASGFKASQSTKFTATSFTQPALGSRYTPTYNYIAPKQNERIVINYNYNQLVGAATFNVESSRPVTANVLVKEANLVELDLTMNVVINPSMTSSTTTILQNLRNALSSALSTNKLGQSVNQITLINIAQGISGINLARIIYFNVTGVHGSILTFQALNNQFFAPNNIVLNTETR
jgi:phage-related baseplate assembly protein